MKQRITKTQIESLNAKQKKAFAKYCNDAHFSEDGFWDVENDTMLYFLSIGQMIEFLDEQNPLGKGFGTVKGTNGLTMFWAVSQYNKSYHEKELADALWLAVKEELK